MKTYSTGSMDVDEFAMRLWGNVYFDEENLNFSRKPQDASAKRSFVHFILEPLYKLYSQVLSEDQDGLKRTLADLQITLKPSVYKMDVRPMLKVVMEAFFGPSKGLVDMIVSKIPSPLEASQDKVSRHPLPLLSGCPSTDLSSSSYRYNIPTLVLKQLN